MKFLTCSHCGFTAWVDDFMDEDEFFSCPRCGMDESGIDEVPLNRVVWATAVLVKTEYLVGAEFDDHGSTSYEFLDEEEENTYTVTIVNPGGNYFEYKVGVWDVILPTLDKIVSCEIIAMRLDISSRNVQNNV